MTRCAFLRDLARFAGIEREGSPHVLVSYLRTLRCPGLWAAAVYRLGHWAIRQPVWLRLVVDPLYFVLHQLIQVLWAIDISRRAEIGAGLYIGHFSGIFVHSDAVLGENCSLSQDVTIGIAGQGAERGVPRIGAYVYIAPGARLFGPIRIGDHARIGANAVVHKDVPAHGVVAVQCTITAPLEIVKNRLAA